MKKSKGLRIFLVVLIFIVIVAGGVYYLLLRPKTSAQPPVDPQAETVSRLREASLREPEFTFVNGFPRFVKALLPVEGEDSAARALNFMENYRELYLQSDPDLQLHVRRVFGEEGESVTLYQTYRGIEVFGGEVVVKLKDDQIATTVGGLLPFSNITIDTIPMISASEAEEIARSETDWTDKTILGHTLLMLFDMSLLEEVPSETHLAWRVTLGIGGSTQMFIDAHTGEVLLKYDLEEGYFELDLDDANGSNAASTDCYWSSTINDNIATWGSFLTSYEDDQDAVLAYWLAYDTYNYFDSYYRDSYDDNGGEVEVYVHADLGGALGRWSYGSMDCDLIEFEDGCLAYDTFVHEFSHGVADFSSQLGDYPQTNALEESLADTLAMAADDDDWILGEDHSLARGCRSNMVRDFANARFTHWDQYNNSASEYDNMEIHNHIVYLIGSGGDGEWATTLTRREIGKMYYYVLTNLPSYAWFIDARSLAEDYAEDWFSPEKVCVVRNAYAAAGIGSWTDDWDCDGTTDFEGDADGVPDFYDNCPSAYNPDQLDTDGDGMGDACDDDDDDDFILDVNDNCPTVPNSSQQDYDNDGIGDHCEDTDFDGVLDIDDNCKEITNPDQLDTDGDGKGDACDADDDNDSILDINDNCSLVPNINQEDTDNDGIGDHCDDSDLDGVYDIDDNCINVDNTHQVDRDGDGMGDACDPDMDGDGVNEEDKNGDPLDNCPFIYNPDQANADGDWIGDACDKCPNDSDFIETYSETFNLPGTPFVPEPYQPDSDGDGIPDLCDDDMEYKIFDTSFEVEVKKKFDFLYLPLPACQPEKENLHYGQLMTKFCVPEPLDENVAFWVGDDWGMGVTKSKMIDGQQCVEFKPLGGRLYTLVLAFKPGTPNDGLKTFKFSKSCNRAMKDTTTPLLPTATPTYTPLVPEVQVPPSPTPTFTRTPTPTITPEAWKCDWFDQDKMALTMFDIQPGSTDLTLYVKHPSGWLGVEVEDADEWIYSAFLGDVEAEKVSFEGYAGRLYIFFKNLPMYMMNTTQELKVVSNHCPLIYQHERVSIIGPEMTPTSSPCRSDLDQTNCTATGGKWNCTPDSCSCVCP